MLKTIKITLLMLLFFFSINLQGDFVNADMKGADQTNDKVSGWFWLLMEQMDKICKIDMLPYWMPLNQGNTKRFDYIYPGSDTLLGYTITIQGTEIVKGVEVVKEVVTESTFPFGDALKGSYKAYLPDLTDGKALVKEYYESGDGFYELRLPFRNMGRYISPIPGKKNSNTYTVGWYNDHNVLVDSGVQVIEVMFLGFENVTVPAGTFKDCLKTSVRFTNSYQKEYEGRTQGVSVEDIIWEAKRIGVVKIKTNQISYMKQIDDDSIDNEVFGGGISELASATIDGVDYP